MTFCYGFPAAKTFRDLQETGLCSLISLISVTLKHEFCLSFTLAVPLVITPQVPKESGLVAAEPQKATLPVVVPAKPNVALTAEVERPNQSQVGVVMIPQAAQPLPSASNGSPPPAQPPLVQAYGPPSSLGMLPYSFPLIREGDNQSYLGQNNRRMSTIMHASMQTLKNQVLSASCMS